MSLHHLQHSVKRHLHTIQTPGRVRRPALPRGLPRPATSRGAAARDLSRWKGSTGAWTAELEKLSGRGLRYPSRAKLAPLTLHSRHKLRVMRCLSPAIRLISFCFDTVTPENLVTPRNLATQPRYSRSSSNYLVIPLDSSS